MYPLKLESNMRTWQLQTAKAQLSKVIKDVITDGPQQISIHGVSRVVLITKEEYDRLTQKQLSFVEFMRESPLVDSNIRLKRDKSF